MTAVEASTDAFTPAGYVAALRELRVEDEFRDERIDWYVRCEGLDVLAGRLVEQAVRDGLGLWQLVGVFDAITRERVEFHEDMQVRLEALLVLHLVQLIRELGPTATDPAAGIWEEYHHEPLSAMATTAPSLACSLVVKEAIEPRSIVLQTREFVRNAHDLGGMNAVRAVVESLRAKLAEAASPA